MRLLTGVQLQGRLILRNSFLINLVLEGLSNTDDLFLLPVYTYNELNVNYDVDLLTRYIRDKKRTKRSAL